jgi:ATP-dependent helicase/nuclease subunit A
MHGILESVQVIEDVPDAIRNMLIDGRITEKEKPAIQERILKALARPEVMEWFRPGLKVMNESEILSSDGTAKRPDRVIIAEDKIIVIDFKFGKEKAEYSRQVKEYGSLLEMIGNKPVECFLWYVDNDKIVKV